MIEEVGIWEKSIGSDALLIRKTTPVLRANAISAIYRAE